MAIERIRTIARAAAQTQIDKRNAEDQRRAKDKADYARRKSEAINKANVEHKARFDNLQISLDVYKEQIEAVHQHYFKDSPTFVLDTYETSFPNNNRWETDSLYNRSITFVDFKKQDGRMVFFTIYALAVQEKGRRFIVGPQKKPQVIINVQSYYANTPDGYKIKRLVKESAKDEAIKLEPATYPSFHISETLDITFAPTRTEDKEVLYVTDPFAKAEDEYKSIFFPICLVEKPEKTMSLDYKGFERALGRALSYREPHGLAEPRQ